MQRAVIRPLAELAVHHCQGKAQILRIEHMVALAAADGNVAALLLRPAHKGIHLCRSQHAGHHALVAQPVGVNAAHGEEGPRRHQRNDVRRIKGQLAVVVDHAGHPLRKPAVARAVGDGGRLRAAIDAVRLGIVRGVPVENLALALIPLGLYTGAAGL